MITDRRLEKLNRVAANRQNMTVIIENVHDPHNIGAVLRSCDAVGIQEVYVLYTESRLSQSRLNELDPTSTGVRKWMHVHFFDDVDACFTVVRSKYDKVLATHLNDESVGLHELDLTQNVAILFGNEHDGISEEALKHTDGNFIIPQVGMVQSLNISVACAVTIYEAMRQRTEAGLYNDDLAEDDIYRQGILDHYTYKHKQAYLK